MKKKAIFSIVVAIILAILLGGVAVAVNYNEPNYSTLVFQFGQIKQVEDEVGVFFINPIIQSTKQIFTGERLYDISQSEVITSDKKTMIADCYVTWKVTDVKKFYQTLSSESLALSRIDAAVYNGMKNVISSTTQDDVISGKDGSLSDTILSKVDSLASYGITVTKIEMKLLDLPSENKNSVYSRMISERQVIAAEYEANGQRDAQNIRSATDATVRQTISEAEVIAAQTEAEGEAEYFSILADAYSGSKSKTEFYNFYMSLEALKESLQNGGTMVIDKTSPLYEILNNSSSISEISQEDDVVTYNTDN
jgi:membrane protease subunit HflC